MGSLIILPLNNINKTTNTPPLSKIILIIFLKFSKPLQPVHKYNYKHTKYCKSKIYTTNKSLKRAIKGPQAALLKPIYASSHEIKKSLKKNL